MFQSPIDFAKCAAHIFYEVNFYEGKSDPKIWLTTLHFKTVFPSFKLDCTYYLSLCNICLSTLVLYIHKSEFSVGTVPM